MRAVYENEYSEDPLEKKVKDDLEEHSRHYHMLAEYVLIEQHRNKCDLKSTEYTFIKYICVDSKLYEKYSRKDIDIDKFLLENPEYQEYKSYSSNINCLGCVYTELEPKAELINLRMVNFLPGFHIHKKEKIIYKTKTKDSYTLW